MSQEEGYVEIIRRWNALICHINFAVKLCSRQAAGEFTKFVPSGRLFIQSLVQHGFMGTAIEGNTFEMCLVTYVVRLNPCYIVSC